MLEKIYTSTKTFNASNLGQCCFISAWGAMFWHNKGTLFKAFKDGSNFPYAEKRSYLLYPRSRGRLVQGVQETGVGLHFYAVDEFTQLSLQGIQPPLCTYTLGVTLPYGNCALVDDENGWLLVCDNGLKAYALADCSLLWSMSVPFGFEAIAWIDRSRVVVGHWDGGQIAFINTLTQTVELETRVSSQFENRGLAYDPVNHLLLALRCVYSAVGVRDVVVDVYLPTPLPAALSAPVFSPATVKRYQGHEVTVQLTGSIGEPCADWWITWALTSGKGDLEKPYSKTDADGYARNYYFGPSLAGELGAETLTAQVVL